MERIDLSRIFEAATPVVGMVHLEPLPGSPGWGGSMAEVLDRARRDARLLEEGGVDGLLVENFGDAPYVPGRVPAETLAAISRIAAAVVEDAGIPVGINVLRNDARGALGVALASGARFVRVNVHSGVMFTDQGLLEGRAHETVRVRRDLDADVAILADVLVKHATPPTGLTAGAAARDLWRRGGADVLVVSGEGTGRSVERARLEAVREATPDAPVWIGSGLTPGTVPDLLPLADGCVVGSALQAGGGAGGRVESDRVRRFMDAVAEVRSGG